MAEHDVGFFWDCHVEKNSGPFVGVLGQECRVFQGSISNVAHWYITTHLRLVLDSELTVESALSVCSRTNSTQKAEEELQGLLAQLSPEIQAAAR